MIKKYRKKPVAIEALEWTGNNLDTILGWCDGKATYEKMSSGDNKIVIDTLEGKLCGSIGDYLIKGIQGEFYFCKPDIFKATYEEI